MRAKRLKSYGGHRCKRAFPIITAPLRRKCITDHPPASTVYRALRPPSPPSQPPRRLASPDPTRSVSLVPFSCETAAAAAVDIVNRPS